MRRPSLRSPGLAAFFVVGLSAVLLTAGGADAVPSLARTQADAIAVRVLRPQADKREVILFGLPKPLPAGSVVVAADPPKGRLGRRAKQRVAPLASPAWLYWLDRMPDAAFSHPSEYLLIDDRSGRVTRRAAIGWYPSVNGAPPAFLASDSAYESARYRVYARLERATRRTASVVRTRPPSVVPKAAFKNDCTLMVGDYHGPGFAQDFKALSEWGTSTGIRSFYTTQTGPRKEAPATSEVAPSGSTLRTNVDTLVDKLDCTDILLFLDGHGTAEGAGPPGVISSSDVTVELDGRVEKVAVGVSADDVATVIKRHPAIGFKLKVNSCYSGRFLDELAPGGKPKLENLLIAESASGASEASYFGRDTYGADGKTKKPPRPDNPDDLSEFVNQNVTGLYSWASSQTEVAASVAAGGSLLANALERAFALGRPANAAIPWGAHPVVVRGAAGEPPEVSVNTFGLGAELKTPWQLAWVDNGTASGAIVFTDRAGNQVGALDPRTGAAQTFPLAPITAPNGIAAIDPLRFAVAGTGGVAVFDRTPPGKITKLVLTGSRLVNIAVGPGGDLYVTNLADNSFVTIRPPYSGPTDVMRTPLPATCVRPTGIVPTAAGLTVLCQSTNNVVFLNPSGGLVRALALPSPNVGAQEPRPTGSSGIVFSGFLSSRLYRLRNDSLLGAATGGGPAVPTVAYYPDDYDALFARQTTDDYALVPHFTAGGATVAEFSGTEARSDVLSILASRNLVGSAIGPRCSPWVAEATPGRPALHRLSFPVPGAPAKPRAAGANLVEHPPKCLDFTDDARTHTITVTIPRAWALPRSVEVGLVGYRSDPWRVGSGFLANFPLQLTAAAKGGGTGAKPRVALKQTGAYTAVAAVTRIPAGARTVTVTITSGGTDAPFGLLTAGRASR